MTRLVLALETLPALKQDAAPIERRSMYRHILIPTDGSELAELGVAHGLSLAKLVGAKVTADAADYPQLCLAV